MREQDASEEPAAATAPPVDEARRQGFNTLEVGFMSEGSALDEANETSAAGADEVTYVGPAFWRPPQWMLLAGGGAAVLLIALIALRKPTAAAPVQVAAPAPRVAAPAPLPAAAATTDEHEPAALTLPPIPAAPAPLSQVPADLAPAPTVAERAVVPDAPVVAKARKSAKIAAAERARARRRAARTRAAEDLLAPSFAVGPALGKTPAAVVSKPAARRAGRGKPLAAASRPAPSSDQHNP